MKGMSKKPMDFIGKGVVEFENHAFSAFLVPEYPLEKGLSPFLTDLFRTGPGKTFEVDRG